MARTFGLGSGRALGHAAMSAAPQAIFGPKGAYYITSTIQTSRGCPFDCAFCSVSNVFGKRYRHRPVEDVVRSIRAGGYRLGITLERLRMFFANASIARFFTALVLSMAYVLLLGK
uniref:radical SAM protein n=1 Tax=Acetomicrobium sp. S15 = DSM 107314 TaxID=2529858 RepID=UPI0031590C2E